MAKLRKGVITFVSLILFTLITDGVAVQCRSNGAQLGKCVPITNCPPLLAILTSSERTIEDIRMLQRLTCITEISDPEENPVVCCPLDKISESLIENSNSSDPIGSKSAIPSEPEVTPSTTTTQSPENRRLQKLKLLPTLEECSVSYALEGNIGGQSVSHGTFPWIARLGYRHKTNGKLEYFCGGSIINNRYILTAGHCTQGFDKNFDLDEVRLGEYDTSTDMDCTDDLTQICSVPEDFKIEKIITHSQYSAKKLAKHNDIALIRVNEDISFDSDFVRPVCLPFTHEYNVSLSADSIDFQNATVAGWGANQWNKTEGSAKLMFSNVPVVSNKRCQQLYKRQVALTPQQMCAGDVRKDDRCIGDEGGPLMLNVAIPNQISKPFQYGVVSVGQTHCEGSLPGVYTRVSEYLSWILETIEP